MPLRDLKCNDCGIEQMDVLLKSMEDIEKEKCPECGGKVRGMFSFPANYDIKGNNSGSTRPKRMGGSSK